MRRFKTSTLLVLLSLSWSSSYAVERIDLSKMAVALGDSCSSVRVLDPRIYLTAAHCPTGNLAHYPEPFIYGKPNSRAVRTPVVAALRPDHSVDDQLMPGNLDFQILLSQQEGPADYPVFPLAEEGQAFDEFVHVGFGHSIGENGNIDGSAPRNLKIARRLREHKVGNLFRIPGRRNLREFTTFHQPDTKICTGDSGGPVFGRIGDSWYLYGLVHGFAYSSDLYLAGVIIPATVLTLPSRWLGYTPRWDDEIKDSMSEKCGNMVYVQKLAHHREEIVEMIDALKFIAENEQ